MAEEIVQEVFLRLWNQPDKFDPERASLRSFLLAQCHGRSVDLLRSETSRRGREER
jgi:RNA polymerase sigma-70 factor (ECF subfamily)